MITRFGRFTRARQASSRSGDHKLNFLSFLDLTYQKTRGVMVA